MTEGLSRLTDTREQEVERLRAETQAIEEKLIRLMQVHCYLDQINHIYNKLILYNHAPLQDNQKSTPIMQEAVGTADDLQRRFESLGKQCEERQQRRIEVQRSIQQEMASKQHAEEELTVLQAEETDKTEQLQKAREQIEQSYQHTCAAMKVQ